MDHEDSDNSNNHHHLYRIIKSRPSLHSFEIRLFYFRICPCAADIVPDHLTVRHLRRELGVSLEINGAKLPSSDAVGITLRRDRVDKETAEVTYVSTDIVRVTGAIEFEVLEGKDLILCGSLKRMRSGNWVNNGDGKTGWSMDYYVGGIGNGSAFFQPKLGILSPSFEVYIAGCCSGVPVILSKTVQVSPRTKMSRQGMLDAIPEGEEGDGDKRIGNGALQQHKLPVEDAEVDDYEPDGKFGHSYYSDDMYTGEDGQLTWFNAGVRVGVGIGLGICLGVGIGVGLIMRSYQATTHSFRRRFF